MVMAPRLSSVCVLPTGGRLQLLLGSGPRAAGSQTVDELIDSPADGTAPRKWGRSWPGGRGFRARMSVGTGEGPIHAGQSAVVHSENGRSVPGVNRVQYRWRLKDGRRRFGNSMGRAITAEGVPWAVAVVWAGSRSIAVPGRSVPETCRESCASALHDPEFVRGRVVAAPSHAAG
jgi:hypothetical protein